MSTGAQVIVAELERAGVEVCFGLPGVHNLALWAALRESSIRLVGVRHEQAAAYAADGYARATGKLGVAITTTGPGAANTLGAVGEAWASRSPILVIATDIPSGCGGRRVPRHPARDRRPGGDVRARGQVHAPRRARTSWRGRSRPRSARRAPRPPGRCTWRSRPTCSPRRSRAAATPGSPPSRLHRAPDLAAAIARWRPPERPLIWVGGGARDAGEAVRALAERLAAPVLTTYGAAGVLPPGHPCLVGLPPHVAAAGRLWDEADVVLAIGSDLDGVQTQNFAQPQPDTLIAVSLERADQLPRRRSLEADAAPRPRWGKASPPRARRATSPPRAPRPARASTRPHCASSTRSASPSPPTATSSWTCASRATGWRASTRPPRRADCRSRSAGGRSGYAFPAALGAALAGTGPAVSISGDGGFLFACGELARWPRSRSR